MVEVFTTNINDEFQVKKIIKILEKSFPKLDINFDLNETKYPYPCGHTILRIEGNFMNHQKIISTINESGYLCDVLEDRVCNKK